MGQAATLEDITQSWMLKEAELEVELPLALQQKKKGKGQSKTPAPGDTSLGGAKGAK